MLAESVEPVVPPPAASESRLTFFRQSGWLMIATIASGALMWGVHFLAKKIDPNEYAVFGTLLAVTMCLPVGPLQMVFAQQTASALAQGRNRQLAGIIRFGLLGTFAVWLLGAVVVLIFQNQLLARWQVTNPVALYVLLVAALLSAWMPMFQGILQGRQNFLWLGWALMLNGIGRVGIAAVVVIVLAGAAAGMMFGVAVGLGISVAIGIWQTKDLWSGKTEPFNRVHWVKQVLPLLLGSGACQFLSTADTMFVNANFGTAMTAPYVAAGTLSRAVMWLVGPLVAVMLPKIVHSAARSEKSDLLKPVLAGTALLTFCGVAGLTILGPIVVKIVYKSSYVDSAVAMLPWYGGAMIPVSLATVLVTNLLAVGRYGIVWVLVPFAAIYGVTLSFIHSSPITVLQTLGGFSLVLLGISAWFTFHHSRKTT